MKKIISYISTFNKSRRLFRIIVAIGLIAAALPIKAQEYWQQESDHHIEVTLDPETKSLDGFETITYVNHSPDTLHFIWIHLWPNAYKNDRTALSEQLLRNGRTDFYFSEEEKRGYINRLDFRVDNTPARLTDHPIHQDISRLELPHPLIPGGIAIITTPFHVKLPAYFSRSGYSDSDISVTQWFPKPAVYDKSGWHEIPYLDQGEFFSEFGKYEVHITAPADYIIAATGSLTDSLRKDSLITWHYQEEKIHDFAFFASRNYMVDRDTLNLNGRTVSVYSYHRKNDKVWTNSLSLIKKAIQTKSEWIGEYPYNTVKAVQHMIPSNGGMEYPTITLIGYAQTEKDLEEIINHEVGHNWFYGILATDERQFPWMDEGINTYYDNRYEREASMNSLKKEAAKTPGFIARRIPVDAEMLMLETLAQERKDQPIATSSQDFTRTNYSLVAYYKTGQWLELMEKELGRYTFDSIMREYYSRWKFKHPTPHDFKKIAESVSGKNLDSLFSLLNRKGMLINPKRNGLRIMSFTAFRESDKHHNLFLAPALGYNNYDKFMVGLLAHNYTLPLPRLRYFAAPLYGSGSRKLNMIGGAEYSFYPGKNDGRIDAGINTSAFSYDLFVDSTGKKNFLDFKKWAPFIRFEFPERSGTRNWIEWKTYLISEKTLFFTRDSNTSYRITYPIKDYFINRLSFNHQVNSTLYPYDYTLLAEQGKEFMKLNFTWNAFFNYGDKKKGGLEARFYAGKFFYLGEKTNTKKYSSARYHLNLTGANGYEDYSYSGYFLGRSDFEGMASRQILRRDGFFKIRTDLLSKKVGKTDDWLCALNFSSAIPDKINPLSMLPLKIPLRAFLDIGTFSEAWDNEATTGKFLYDAGLELVLAGNLIHIYAPLLMSKVFRDYINSTITEKKFLNTLSFSINLEGITLRNLLEKNTR